MCCNPANERVDFGDGFSAPGFTHFLSGQVDQTKVQWKRKFWHGLAVNSEGGFEKGYYESTMFTDISLQVTIVG